MSTNSIQDLLREGAGLHLAGKLADAELKYREALSVDAANAVAYNNLGFLLTQMGKMEEGKQQYLESIRHNEHYATAYSNLGQWCMLTKDWVNARKYLEQALLLDDADFGTQQSLASLHLILQHPETAELYYRNCYAIDPVSSVLVNLAHCLVLQQKIDEAAELLQIAMPEEKDNPKVYALYGIIHFAKNDFGSAIRYFKFSLGMEPDDTEVRYNLALSYLSIGKGQEALLEFKRILLLEPRHNACRNNLGVLLFSAGNMEGALQEFETSIHNNHQDAKAWYYKSLILLKSGARNAAKEAIRKTIETGDADYVEKSKDMLQVVLEHEQQLIVQS